MLCFFGRNLGVSESSELRKDYEMLELGREGEDSQAEGAETVTIRPLDFLCDPV